MTIDGYITKPGKRTKPPTNGKCSNFVNANCSYNCPNKTLEFACEKWDLDPSGFRIKLTSCKECYYNDDNCNCEDCYVNGVDEFCKNAKKKGKEL